jgi:hypothetical protein
VVNNLYFCNRKQNGFVNKIFLNMKKSLLFLCLTFMAALMAYSQSLQLSDSAGPIANNATRIKYGLPAAEEIVSFVFVKNTKSDSISVKVKKVELFAQQGTSNVFCWGLCFDPSIFVSPDPIWIHAGVTDSTNFSGHYIPNGMIGTSTIRYVFFDANNPSDTVCVNIEFSTYPQGIHDLYDVTLSNAYPNPANNSVSFSYSLLQTLNAKLIIRNVLGAVVKEVDIANNSGKLSINTSDFADGVYFYTFQVNGKSHVTKKLVIRH